MCKLTDELSRNSSLWEKKRKLFLSSWLSDLWPSFRVMLPTWDLHSQFPLWGMIFLQKYEDPTPFQISCHWLSCLISVMKSSPLSLFKMATVHYPSPILWQSLIPLDSLCFLNPLDLPEYCVYLCSLSVGELHTEGSLPCYALFFPAPRTLLTT